MSNYAPRTNSKEQEAYANFQKTINIYMQHPLPDGALERTKEYAERIKERLENKGWTQANLARKVGVSKQTITNMINASSSAINLRRLYVVSAALECTPSYMLGLVEKDIDHYDKDTNDKNTWDPILSIDTAMKRFQNILHEACRTDPFFVDFICQIVENRDIPRANRIMMDARLAKQRKFEPGLIPDSWIAEWRILRKIEDKEMVREIDQLKIKIARQKRQISRLQKMLRGKKIKKGRLLPGKW
ncbi:MAG: helix-turn-helix domain-containing protein [Oscillibacter sp.]|nr:helix-turn-helix domain-containing protein [Oscillibacter sp.]